MPTPKAKQELEQFLTYGGYGRVQQEVQFHPSRKWRADFFLPDQRPPIIIEYDGLMRHNQNQGHASITKIMRDSEKGNEAQALGYRFLRANAKSLSPQKPGDVDFYDLLDRVLEKIP